MTMLIDPELRELLDRLAPAPTTGEIPAWQEIMVRASTPSGADAPARPARRGRRFVHRWLTGWFAPLGGRTIAVAGGIAVVGASVVLVLLAPWQSGPVALTQAQAATVIRQAIAAAEPSPGAIFHERYEINGVPWAGAGRVVRATNEVWYERGGEQRFRSVQQTIVPPVSIELGRVAGSPGLALFDPRTNGIYRIPASDGVQPVGPFSSASGDIADRLRTQLTGGRLADGWVVTRTSLDGRDVYRISNMQSSRSGPIGLTYYVDADTYVPVQIEEPGMPKNEPGGPREKPKPGGSSFSRGPSSPASLTVTRILTYEHLDGSDAHLAQLDLKKAHPAAADLPFAQLRADVRERVVPSGPSAPAPAAPTTGGTAPRLTVDPETASIGTFTIGEKLLDLAPLLNPPIANFAILPDNLTDAAAAGSFDHGILVVTFRDAAQEHSTSAYLTRPFKTTTGDVNTGNDVKGTTLDEFLSHWPDHGTPTAGTGAGGERMTTVDVRQATFFFNSDNRLSAVKLGEGDAETYAGLANVSRR